MLLCIISSQHLETPSICQVFDIHCDFRTVCWPSLLKKQALFSHAEFTCTVSKKHKTERTELFGDKGPVLASIDSSLCPRTTHSSCLAQRRYEASWSPPAKTPLHVFFSIAFCSLATSRDQARAWLWLCDLGSAGIPESFFTFAPSFWRTRRWAAPFSHSRSCLILRWQPNSAEKRRECPELSKRVRPRLPNLPSPQPINLP